MLMGLVNVCVPAQVLLVVVPKAREKVATGPTSAPAPEIWSGYVPTGDEVATLVTPAVPFEEYRRLPCESAVVVARPVQVTVESAPLTSVPSAAYPLKGPEKVSVVVDTSPSVAGVPFVVVQYARRPAVSLVEVETVPMPVPPPVASRVVPSKVRFVPTVRDFISEVPLPTRMPPRVVEAVPPEETGSADERASDEAVTLPEKSPLPVTDSASLGDSVPIPTKPAV